MNTKVGRPTDDNRTRDRLIEAARVLFVKKDFDKVSIRLISQQAGVDSSLIRYYFGNKAGLFGAMMKETAEPIEKQLKQVRAKAEFETLADLLRTYYRVMGQNPDFPKLVFRLANMDDSSSQVKAFKSNLIDSVRPHELFIFEHLKRLGLLHDDIDPQLAQISFMSLVIFPFIVPDLFKQLHQIQLTPEHLAKLAEQNISLLTRGLLKNKD